MFNPDRDLLVTAGDDAAIRFWNLNDSGAAFAITDQITRRCPVDTAYVVRLSTLSVTADDTFVADSRNNSIAVTFTGLTEDQLATLGVAAVSVPQDAPLLDGNALYRIVVFVIVAASIALVSVPILRGKLSNKDVTRETEAIVLLAVVIAIIILGITAKISGDGLISVLSAIIGWSAGRATRGD